jgi:hypothetical protein
MEKGIFVSTLLVKKPILWVLKLLNDGPNKGMVDKCSSLLRLFWFEEQEVQDRIGTIDELVVNSHMLENKAAVKTTSQERAARSSLGNSRWARTKKAGPGLL